MCLAPHRRRWRQDSPDPLKTNLQEWNGQAGSAMHHYLERGLVVFNVVQPIAIMAAITSSSLAPSRRIHTMIASRCCLRVAVMADLSEKLTEVRHRGSVPIADFSRGHQRHAVMGEHVVEQGFQIFDAMRNSRNIGMDRNRHHARIGCALEI